MDTLLKKYSIIYEASSFGLLSSKTKQLEIIEEEEEKSDLDRSNQSNVSQIMHDIEEENRQSIKAKRNLLKSLSHDPEVLADPNRFS